MKRRSFITGFLVAVALLTVVWPGWCTAGLEEKSRNIDLIIEKSGLKGQLAALPAALQEQLPKTGDQDEQYRNIAAIISASFATEKIVPEVKRIFMEKYHKKYATEVLKFYDSALGVKMVGLELAAFEPGFREKMSGFDITAYAQKRRTIITKLFADMDVVDTFYLLSAAMMESAFLAVNALLPEENRASAAVIAGYQKKIKEQCYSEANKQKLLAEFYLIYETATDDELEQYAKFNRGKACKWANQCMVTGLVNGLKQCTESMIAALVDYAKENLTDNPSSDEREDETRESPEDTSNSYL